MSGDKKHLFQRGFTFVEILAAMLFMAIVIPATMRGILLANRVDVAAQRKNQAAELADRMLSEKVATDEWRMGDQKGDFGTEAPGFRWELSAKNWTQGSMRLITLKVIYTVQDREYSEELSTLGDETQSDETNQVTQ